MIQRLKQYIGRLIRQSQKPALAEINDLKLMMGRLLEWQLAGRREQIKCIRDAEFKVYSQWGDDGIIQYLIMTLPVSNRYFIEFGVENYLESNTRFLLTNNHWGGLVMDGSHANIDYIHNDVIYWKYDLLAKSAFVTAENVNILISAEGIHGDIGLLHIDIDGNDYWVWEALTCVSPAIVIVEFNAIFGHQRPISIPYRDDFIRSKAHYSCLYAGASLPALIHLASRKGYTFVGANSACNNAYFVRNDLMNSGVKGQQPEAKWTDVQFRESRHSDGSLSFLKGDERLAAIKGLPVVNVITMQTEFI